MNSRFSQLCSPTQALYSPSCQSLSLAVRWRLASPHSGTAGEAVELLRLALTRGVVLVMGMDDTVSARERALRVAVGKGGTFPWLGGAASAIASPPRRRDAGGGSRAGAAARRAAPSRATAPSYVSAATATLGTPLAFDDPAPPTPSANSQGTWWARCGHLRGVGAWRRAMRLGSAAGVWGANKTSVYHPTTKGMVTEVAAAYRQLSVHTQRSGLKSTCASFVLLVCPCQPCRGRPPAAGSARRPWPSTTTTTATRMPGGRLRRVGPPASWPVPPETVIPCWSLMSPRWEAVEAGAGVVVAAAAPRWGDGMGLKRCPWPRARASS